MSVLLNMIWKACIRPTEIALFKRQLHFRLWAMELAEEFTLGPRSIIDNYAVRICHCLDLNYT